MHEESRGVGHLVVDSIADYRVPEMTHLATTCRTGDHDPRP